MGTVQATTIFNLCHGDAKRIEALRKRIARNAPGVQFGKHRELSTGEVDIIRGLIAGHGQGDMDKVARTRRGRKGDKGADTAGQSTDMATSPDADIIKEKDAELSALYRERIEIALSKSRETTAWQRALLWLCLALSLGSSVPNMYSVMLAVKESQPLAAIVTAAFTVAPLLLLACGVKGFSRIGVYAPILVEVFCNTAGFYGGLTGLQHNTFVAPTTFLHMVTSMTNSAYEPTAFWLSAFFAVCIAILAIVPVNQLNKR